MLPQLPSVVTVHVAFQVDVTRIVVHLDSTFGQYAKFHFHRTNFTNRCYIFLLHHITLLNYSTTTFFAFTT